MMMKFILQGRSTLSAGGLEVMNTLNMLLTFQYDVSTLIDPSY